MTNTRFNFDEYAEKATNDPRCFAADRERLILRQIARSRDPVRIASYQSQIDSMRLGESSGIEACRRLEAEMFDHLEILVRLIKRLQGEFVAIAKKPRPIE